jgi:hypothetical protein
MKDQLLQLQNRITELENENMNLRKRLDKTYEFIHHTGNSEYAGQDWDGVMDNQNIATGNAETIKQPNKDQDAEALPKYAEQNNERLNRLTRQFGVDEYPLE